VSAPGEPFSPPDHGQFKDFEAISNAGVDT